jgi:hypothetical protein
MGILVVGHHTFSRATPNGAARESVEGGMKLSDVNFKREGLWLLIVATLVPVAGLLIALVWPYLRQWAE